MPTTLILGASSKPGRFANQAQHALLLHGHSVILINPREDTIDGIPCLANISEVSEPVDTVTLYINPDILNQEIDSILKLKPRRVIFNPGTESDRAATIFQDNGIEVIKACTLVMLSMGKY